jgi:hypothetical protein
MKSQRNERRFRPAFDDCERRELLSTVAVVSPPKAAPGLMSLTGPAPIKAGLNAVAPQRIQGYYTPGYWHAGNDLVAVFAVEFTGALTKANATNAYNWGKSYVTSREISLDTTGSAGTIRTVSDDNYLLAWYNVTRNEGGWIAGTYAGSRTWVTPGYVAPWYRPWEKSYPPEIHTVYKLTYIRNDQTTATVEGAVAPKWTTRGYPVVLRLEPLNSSRDVKGSFSGGLT